MGAREAVTLCIRLIGDITNAVGQAGSGWGQGGLRDSAGGARVWPEYHLVCANGAFSAIPGQGITPHVATTGCHGDRPLGWRGGPKGARIAEG
eukprot:1942-Hanusia_phi.AAC.4